MNTKTITEATLTAPTFSGSDDEVSAATQGWSSIINSLSYLNSQVGYGCAPISDENKKAIYAALSCYLQCKMDEVNNVSAAPQVATAAPSFTPAPVAPVAPQETPMQTQPEVEISYATESKKPVSPILKRMRELAGIPHETNRV